MTPDEIRGLLIKTALERMNDENEPDDKRVFYASNLEKMQLTSKEVQAAFHTATSSSIPELRDIAWTALLHVTNRIDQGFPINYTPETNTK